ncbi:MAG: SDR family NAD(P)-dependent oxidoreductase [Verrucomicrobiota bacterium]
MGDPKKQVALITGAGGGLGRAIATDLAKINFEIGVHYYRNKEGAFITKRILEDLGTKAHVLEADLTKPEEAIRLVHELTDNFGRLDLLVNNSGVYHMKTLSDLSFSEWQEGIHSTATTTFLMTQNCLPLLRQSNNGRIINIGDSSCDRIGARNLSISYHIGKTGVLMLTKSFAQEEAKQGVTVNMVSPGCLENSIDNPDPTKIPAGKLGAFEDITEAIRFLIKPEAGYITGSNIIASGGWNLR